MLTVDQRELLSAINKKKRILSSEDKAVCPYLHYCQFVDYQAICLGSPEWFRCRCKDYPQGLSEFLNGFD